MPERVVDRLEPVKVHEEDRTTVLPANGAQQRIVQCPAKHFPVGEAGERILPRKPIELYFRLPHLSQVRGKAAEAEEAPYFIVNGPAGDRPPDLILGLGAYDQILKGDMGREIEAERALRCGISLFGVG